MGHNKAELAEVAARRAELIRLRRAGVRFEDPRIMRLGYPSRQSATKDFKRALEERRDDQAAEASVYRQEANERIEALLEAVWPRATEPTPIFKDGEEIGSEIDLKAVETVLKLIDRHAKLNGLDTPVRTELSGVDGGPLALSNASPDELAALIAATSRLDSADPANTATSTADVEPDGEATAP
jgi:hypothetical protein